MLSKEKSWIKIAESAEALFTKPNEIKELEVAGKIICIARHKDQVFAFAPKCPHASGRFADGFIDAVGHVVCPLHHYRFCMKTGRNVSGEGYFLKHWPIKIEAGVYINFGIV